MNRFKPFVTFIIPLLLHLAAFGQSCRYVDEETLKSSVVAIDELTAEIGEEVLKALGDIDFHTIASDAVKMGVQNLDWTQPEVQPDMTSHYGFQKEKIIEKVYPICSQTKVSIANRYGKIRLHNWARREIKVTVRIRTAENSEKRAQEALDRVHIDESISENNVSFKTNILADDSSWWSSLTSGATNRALQVDYEIYLPRENELALANRYGPIELGDRDGRVAISVSYGSLQAGRLQGPNNSLAVAYSSAAIVYLNEGDVSVRYGGFKLSEAEKITLAMSTSSGGYIGKVNREADISLRYSSGFEMGLGPAIQKANVAASYSNVHIKPATGAAFHFSVSVSYGGFDYDPNRISIGSKSERNTSKSYTGYWNKAVNNSVNISSRYGGVSLK